jgi:hypothetical protein
MAQAPYRFDIEGRSTEVAAISLATGRDKCQARECHMNSRFSDAYRACALYFGPGTPARVTALPCCHATALHTNYYLKAIKT